MNFVSIFLGILFTVSGILFSTGRIHSHLSVWKNMPKQEKDNVNIIPLCRNIGEVITLSGLIFLLNGFWKGFSRHWFAGSMIAWLIVAGLDIWYITKSSHYRRK